MRLETLSVQTWPTVDWTWPQLMNSMPAFHHAATYIHPCPLPDAQHSGESIWLLNDAPVPVGLAWEWSEVIDGIVMLANPNSVVSNLRCVDNFQLAAPHLSLATLHNHLVHSLPWQRQVRRSLALEALKDQHTKTGRALPVAKAPLRP